MYDVRVYINTGFDHTNIPDGNALLNSCTYLDLPATDLMQSRFLTSISVRVSGGYESVENADYCLIGSEYYFIDAINMTSNDVAKFTLSPDYLTTLGGPLLLTDYLDGVVERAHVSDDTFGLWTAEEPFTPNAPLEIVRGEIFGDTDGQDHITVVLSTVDLENTDTLNADDYITEDSNTVAVPRLEAVSKNVYSYIYNGEDYRSAAIPCVLAYNPTIGTVLTNIARARSLGQESAIIAQYILPNAYISGVAGHEEGESSDSVYDVTDYYNLIAVSGLRSAITEADCGLPFIYETVQNNKALTGKLNAYVLISVGSGSRAQFNPEDILNDSETSPVFIYYADLRYNQMPYARPKYFLKNSDNYWENTVQGMNWANAPLVYVEPSGYQFTQKAYSSQMELTRAQNSYNLLSKTTGYTPGTGVAGALKSAFSTINRGLTSALGTAGTWLNNGYVSEDAEEAIDWMSTGDIDMLKKQQSSEYTQTALSYMSNAVIAPDIQFPRSDSMRDFFGNGFVVFRYRLSSEDLSLYDRFLTMYGYAMNKTIEAEDFNNRTYFNFVKCSDVTVGGTASRYLREGASAQLRGGVRVWHVLPSPDYYSSNPIKEES